LFYTASGIITPVGGRPVHNLDLLMMSTIVSMRFSLFDWTPHNKNITTSPHI